MPPVQTQARVRFRAAGGEFRLCGKRTNGRQTCGVVFGEVLRERGMPTSIVFKHWLIFHADLNEWRPIAFAQQLANRGQRPKTRRPAPRGHYDSELSVRMGKPEYLSSQADEPAWTGENPKTRPNEALLPATVVCTCGERQLILDR